LSEASYIEAVVSLIDGSIRVWDVSKRFDFWSKAHYAGVTALAVGQDTMIVTGSRDYNDMH
jgi:hypothetical protein